MEQHQKRTWAEIDLGALEHNYRTLRAMLPQQCRFLGVVKANAYGHGALAVARRLEGLGADYLAVACIDEAAELRVSGITAPILVLGPTPIPLSAEPVRLRLTQTVGDLESAKALSAAAQTEGRKVKIHIKVDTGMSRLGFVCDEAHMAAAVEEIAAICALPGLEPEGIFTHFSDADSCEDFTMVQFTRFLDLLEALKGRGITFAIRHCAASSATLKFPCTHLDMVRPGLALYGHYPDPSCEGLDVPGLTPVMRLCTRVAAVHTVPAGAYVSYGRTARLAEEQRLAVLPIGYADGLFRTLSNRGAVSIRGVSRPITGRVCMDLCMVPAGEDVQVGDVATVYGPEQPVETAAELAGTVSYELLSAVSRRVPRIYRG